MAKKAATRNEMLALSQISDLISFVDKGERDAGFTLGIVYSGLVDLSNHLDPAVDWEYHQSKRA